MSGWATFKQRTQTLEDFLGAWFGPMKDTLDELGAEEVEDLKELEPDGPYPRAGSARSFSWMLDKITDASPKCSRVYGASSTPR